MTQEYEIQRISIDFLTYDPENPRLPSTINTNDQRAIIDWMLKDATIIELMGAIGEKGYFPGEPLLVIRATKEPGKYIVVEGNRRLTALKLLQQPSLASRLKKSVEQAANEAKEHPSEVPVIIFANREYILDYLGYRHITGIKAWSSLAKTKYLAKLLESLPSGEANEQYRTLAKLIGSRTDHVAKMLTGLAMYNRIVEEDFFGISGLDEESINFAVLTTAISYGHIVDFLGLESNKDRELNGLNMRHLQELTDWVFRKNDSGSTRVGESRNLIDLNKVIGNDRALAAFRGGESLFTAYLLTDAPEEIFRKAIIDSQTRLEVARDIFQKVNYVASSDSDNLTEIFKLARNLKLWVDQKILDDAE